MGKNNTSRRAPRKKFVEKKRVSILKKDTIIDETNMEFLSNFVTGFGKIVPARLSGANAKQQRQIRRAVKRARNMGLLK